MDFIALDVETANASLASICQVGIVMFRGGQVLEQWQTLVNPEDYFDLMASPMIWSKMRPRSRGWLRHY